MLWDRGDTGAYAASQPLDREPGSHWQYSSGTTNIISRIIRHVIGDQGEYFAFPRNALFNKIGMRGAVIEPDAAGNLVGVVFALARPEELARDADFGIVDGKLAVGIIERQRDLGHTQGRPDVASAEDDIFHVLPAEHTHLLLAHHPPNGVGDIAFAAPVGSDDGRNTRLQFEGGLSGKRFETKQFKLLEIHAPNPRYEVKNAAIRR